MARPGVNMWMVSSLGGWLTAQGMSGQQKPQIMIPALRCNFYSYKMSGIRESKVNHCYRRPG